VVNPRTVNAGIIVPLTGADVDLWGEDDINPNMVAIDGFIGGVQAIAVTGAGPVTLTAPAGFTASPTPGPTQSQNRVLRFTGALTANQQITLPLPGAYIIENFTTGNFLLTFRGAVAATEVIAINQGDRLTIYNDGSNVRFADLGKMGDMEFWAGVTAMPAWVNACTVPPYLLCDGAVSNFSVFPYLGARMGSVFGGNGVSTFATPDMRGRYPLAYDGTGTRVTVAGCGINGQTLGAVLDAQTITLTSNQMPSHYHSAGIYDPTHSHSSNGTGVSSSSTGGGGFTIAGYGSFVINAAATGVRVNSPNGLDTTYSTGGGAAHNNMPNTQVAGIWVVKT
jgi:microcystin-dependent protein